MSETKSIWTVSIIVQYDSHREDIRLGYAELEDAILFQQPTDAIRYVMFFYDQRNRKASVKELQYGCHGVPKFVTIHDYGIIDLYSGPELAEFFKVFAHNKEFNTQGEHRNLVLTWGHGAGYGFFSERKSNKELIYDEFHFDDTLKQEIQFYKAQFSIPDESINYRSLYTLRADSISSKIPFDEWVKNIQDEVKVISVLSIKTIIEESIKKADIMLTMNCYVQTFEAGYILGDSVELLIAPQNQISFFGYNYIKLFQLLTSKPESSLEELAENIAAYYSIKFHEEPVRSIIPDASLLVAKNTSFSAIYLKGFNDSNLNDLLNKIGTYLNSKYSSKHIEERCKKARHKCSPVNITSVVDFRHFFIEFSRYYDNDILIYDREIQPFQEDLFNYREKYEVAFFRPGHRFEADLGREHLPSMGPQFFSIFFPFSSTPKVLSESILFGYGQIMKNSEWMGFVKKINGIYV